VRSTADSHSHLQAQVCLVKSLPSHVADRAASFARRAGSTHRRPTAPRIHFPSRPRRYRNDYGTGRKVAQISISGPEVAFASITIRLWTRTGQFPQSLLTGECLIESRNGPRSAFPHKPLNGNARCEDPARTRLPTRFRHLPLCSRVTRRSSSASPVRWPW
jgi:hypothetical protein